MSDRAKEVQMVQPRLAPPFTPIAGTVGARCDRCGQLHTNIIACGGCGKVFCKPCWAIIVIHRCQPA